MSATSAKSGMSGVSGVSGKSGLSAKSDMSRLSQFSKASKVSDITTASERSNLTTLTDVVDEDYYAVNKADLAAVKKAGIWKFLKIFFLDFFVCPINHKFQTYRTFILEIVQIA